MNDRTLDPDEREGVRYWGCCQTDRNLGFSDWAGLSEKQPRCRKKPADADCSSIGDGVDRLACLSQKSLRFTAEAVRNS